MLKYEHVDADLKTMAKIVAFSNKETMTYFPMHFHNSSELLYCEKGTLHVRVYDNEYILKSGDMLYINSNIPHETKSVESNHVYMIQMKKPFFDNKELTIDLNTCINDMFKDKQAYHTIIELMKDIYHINYEKEELYQFLVLSKLELLKYELLKNALARKEDSTDLSTETHLKLAEILRFIDDNLGQGISVTEISEVFNYTLPYFSALFKEKTGITCNEYIQGKRLRQAMKLIQEEDLSINEVAYEVGFSNSKAMRQLFKRELGVTPSQYLSLYRDEQKQ